MKRLKKMLPILICAVLLLSAAGLIFVNQPKFGRSPRGKRLERIERSPNYRDGEFRNLAPTPQLTTDKSFGRMLFDFLFRKVDRLRPEVPVPVVKTDLKALPADENVLVWLGHSAYFIRLDGKTFLVDPALLTASPLPFSVEPFEGADCYKPSDMPHIDYLIITHDHWDHLDHQTVTRLKGRVGRVIAPLGVGEHFERWGFSAEQIVELDWYEAARISGGFRLTALPARHFSGRGLKRNKTLWASFMLESPSRTIYLGGDSGYGTFYRTIADKFPLIDLAVLENGQYSEDWRHIHTMPDELPQTVADLRPLRVLTVHHAKFALGKHEWDEPLRKARENARDKAFRLLTPRIGEVVRLDDEGQEFGPWWDEAN